MKFSFIIPVYNRSEELRALLESFAGQRHEDDFTYEIIVVDDGSQEDVFSVVKRFENRLPVVYLRKPNTGPGDSRNKGMQMARGAYFVILDSDVILPVYYLRILNALEQEGRLTDLGGGPDTSATEFSDFQKAVDLVMTSYLTTGGIRGKKKELTHYVPRSFNMIVKREVFERTGGFSSMHPGEDPEWVYRAWKQGFRSGFYPELFVYHKRRIDREAFFKQMKKFGMARVILLRKFPEFSSPVFYFPWLYTAGLFAGISGAVFGYPWLLWLYVCYWAAVLSEFLIKSKSLKISILGLVLFQVQMIAYAWGFGKAFVRIRIGGLPPETAFPELFFNLKEQSVMRDEKV